MKNITLTCLLWVLCFVAYSQATSEGPGMLSASTFVEIKPADCIGEWISPDGYHLTLYGNNKAVWKDDSHIYYMTWRPEVEAQNDNIKISLTGTDNCKHKSFYLGASDTGVELVEDQTNVHMRSSKELTATIQ